MRIDEKLYKVLFPYDPIADYCNALREAIHAKYRDILAVFDMMQSPKRTTYVAVDGKWRKVVAEFHDKQSALEYIRRLNQQ